jgi:hypothetical protein
MIDIISEKKANFNFKTKEILFSIFCCYSFMPRSFLRKSVYGRKVLNYQHGMLYINKDLDIAKIIKKLRVVNYFMKM